MRLRGWDVTVATMLCWALIGPGARAAELEVLSFPPLRSALNELLPQFEKNERHSVKVQFGTPVQFKERVQRGDGIDVLIASKQVIGELHGSGRITDAVDVARVGMGVAVRKGAQMPDIGSVEAFKHALLSAGSVGHIDPKSGAPGGIYLTTLFERLGIAADMKTKVKHFGPSGAEAALAAGEIELVLSQATVILASPGIVFVGPLPAEIQYYLHFSAAVGAGSKQADAASSLVRFFSSPAAVAVLRAKGFE